ncbi:Yos1-like protein [Cutaneotrichosporon oleaginosum]|uniref:Yos1-like protein n=1 Tax=Cutaneotrichosporon oleaginosum TaxID=879819 RepID=A0A0J0XYQ5_9TREE|nr:Yos1-like protein [Cutaneotrichosporon oleaginosum]KLT46187.1 Yos1-like protein [Cutaneotrichosporon oleaginosum]TXT10194.1 hypothetical protein COLE_04128 [Cutaneotrichosporon oleaginosum]
MLFGFGNILLAALLLVNAVAILNEERFLARTNSGFGNVPDPTYDGAYGGNPDGVSFKTKVVNLIGAVRTLMRLPLIVINVVVILFLLIAG